VKPNELLRHLVATADDLRLSRSERRAIHALLHDEPIDVRQRLQVEAGLFDAAAERMHDPRDKLLLRWLEDSLRALQVNHGAGAPPAQSRAWFGPQDPLAKLLAAQIAAAREHIAAAVFTITDDRIHDALVAAHHRGVALRIITDGRKAQDRGSDIWRLQRAGIAIHPDPSAAWMHHKFAVMDERVLVNGSYNWTRAGAQENRENFLVTTDPLLVRAYLQNFERIWAELEA